jgi:enamine deaminase RidA (YjgF/YER057c/UK114 family)
MSRTLISSGSPFEKQAGYSRALVDEHYVHVAGTTGYDYASMTMPDGVEAQTRNIFTTIAATLQEAGSDISKVVRARYYLTSRDGTQALFKVTGEVFGDVRPAATLIICDLMQEEMLVEIEVTATR